MSDVSFFDDEQRGEDEPDLREVLLRLGFHDVARR